MKRRAVVRLGLECDGACVFCAQAGASGPTLDHAAALEQLSQARASSDELTFVGRMEEASCLAKSAFPRVDPDSYGSQTASSC